MRERSAAADLAAGGSAKRSSGAEWEEDAADRDDSAWRAAAWLPAAVRERIVAAVGGCGRGGVGGRGGEVIGRGVAAMERRRGLADSDLGAQLEPATELGFSIESIRVECLGVDDDRISLRMPLPGRAVLLAAAVESTFTPYLLFSSCPSPPARHVQSTTTAPPSCGEDPVTVSAKLHRISPQTPPAYPAPPRRGKDAPASPSPNPR